MNYLNTEELKILNNLVSGYFDFAEIQAMKHNPMYMDDYIKHLDTILTTTGGDILNGSGKISHRQAEEKALSEYKKYQTKTLSSVEKSYFDTIKQLGTKTKRIKK